MRRSICLTREALIPGSAILEVRGSSLSLADYPHCYRAGVAEEEVW